MMLEDEGKWDAINIIPKEIIRIKEYDKRTKKKSRK